MTTRTRIDLSQVPNLHVNEEKLTDAQILERIDAVAKARLETVLFTEYNAELVQQRALNGHCF